MKAHLAGQRLRCEDRAPTPGELGHRLGRRLFGQVATIVTADTILFHPAGSANDVAHLRAGALAGPRVGNFFTTEVWTARGLVTSYTAFLLELQSPRVQVIGCTPHPNETFVIQCLRQATCESSAVLCEGRSLLCDRDPKWSRRVPWLATAGVRIIRNARARAELQRVRRAVRPVGEGGMRESRGADRRTALYVRRFTNSPRTTIESGIIKDSGTS